MVFALVTLYKDQFALTAISIIFMQVNFINNTQVIRVNMITLPLNEEIRVNCTFTFTFIICVIRRTFKSLTNSYLIALSSVTMRITLILKHL